jgi:hypothetical protein
MAFRRLGSSMGAGIPDSVKSTVTQKWLAGMSRDAIAAECGLSGGAVSGIIANWKHTVGADHAYQLRELAVALKNMGLTLSEAAKGVRVFNIMSNLGVDEEYLESFISRTYNRIIGIGLQPEHIATYLSNLASFRATNEETGSEGWQGGQEIEAGREKPDNIPLFSQILRYVEEMKEEKNKLMKEIDEKSQNMKEIDNELRFLKNERLGALRQHDEKLKELNITEKQLEWYSEVKAELSRYGIPVDDVKRFVRHVQWIQEKGVNISQILNQFSSYSEMTSAHVLLHHKVSELEQKAEELEQSVQAQNLKIMEIKNLKSMGFGLRELKQLYHTLQEIAEENGLPLSDGSAKTRFFAEIENNYDAVLGFEIKLAKLRVDYERLSEARNLMASRIEKIPYVGSAIASLLRRGLHEDDIIKVANLLDSHPHVVEALLKKNVEHPMAEPLSKEEPDVIIPEPGPPSDEHPMAEPLSKEEPDVIIPEPGPPSDQNIINGSNIVEDHTFQYPPRPPKPTRSRSDFRPKIGPRKHPFRWNEEREAQGHT